MPQCTHKYPDIIFIFNKLYMIHIWADNSLAIIISSVRGPAGNYLIR